MSVRPSFIFLAIPVLCTLLSSVAFSNEFPARKIDFSRQILPILADKCLACHGADANHRQGSLRLDDRDNALSGGDSNVPTIVPGRPELSELIARINSTDENEQMPPPSLKKPLSADEKELLQTWITQDAEYQEHWAFSAPVRPPLPEVQQQNQSANPIDLFVRARLEQAGLSPSPQADRMTLLRRLTLDLTGLPPTLDELDAFLSDDSSNAYQSAVERLLNSPHYGERWGRIWLDGARYADSDGYEKDKPRFVWPYRDWVVNALNANLPYDQFIIEQLAGDLLPNATLDQITATGFLRNSMLNEEGGVDPEQFRMEAMFDRMDAFGKNLLGLTVQCSQCHDHKFDPISQREYFQLFAFFNDTYDSSVPYLTPDQRSQADTQFTEISRKFAEGKAQFPDWKEHFDNWQQAALDQTAAWVSLAPPQVVSGGQKEFVLPDNSILAQGYAPTSVDGSYRLTTELKSIHAVKLELLNHPDLPRGGPGRAVDGTCILSEIEIQMGPADGSSPPARVKIRSATANANPRPGPLPKRYDNRSGTERTIGGIDFAIDGKRETGWSTDLGLDRSNVPREAVFVLEDPPSFESGTVLNVILMQNHGGWNSDDNQQNNIGRFRLSVTEQDGAIADPLSSELRHRLSGGNNLQLTSLTELPLEDYCFDVWRTHQPELAQFNEEIETLWSQLPQATTQPAMQARDQERMTSLLAKGNFLTPIEPVQKKVPAIFHPMEVENPTRLDLARWVVDERSPTAARAIVNRIWQTYFGIGIVSTSEDFGLQGEFPSHPELLDWLAVEFMESGWNIKQLHRLIVSSSTYQQQSQCSRQLRERDPDNRLLARGARFRMEAEGVRDMALAASGLIDLRSGGPPVYPPAPEFLFLPPASYGPKTWTTATGADRYRRAIYTFRFRSVPYPALQVFDAPIGEVACIRRVQSNTPLQALAALNEPVFMECARQMGHLAVDMSNKTDDQRLEILFRRCTARTPSEQELRFLRSFLNQQRERLNNNELDASTLMASQPTDANSDTTTEPVTESAKDPDSTPAGISDPAQRNELAAWTTVSRVLLNLDEAVTRE